MDFKEIIAELKNQDITVEDFAYGDIPNPLVNIGSWSTIDKYGGEGQGSRWDSTKFFPEHNIYIKTSGYYSSYNGADFSGWEDCRQVVPTEKTITVYE